ncbi:MAG: ABC transporter permease [Halothermotrichaceae bacterium]
MLELMLDTIEEGLPYGLMAMGVFITFRILDFPDLTVEGSFPLGAAVATILIISGFNPFLATFIAFLAGAAAGVITGIINTKLKIAGLLAGILTMTSLYSINLRIMGKSNLSLLGSERPATIFSIIKGFLGNLVYNFNYLDLVILAIIILFIKLLIDYFLHTELGMAVRATGDNQVMIQSLGVNIDFIKILGLALANGLVALAGSLVAQYQKSADIRMGAGMIVIGLASVIIGEVIIRTSKIKLATLGVIIGAIVYRMAIAFALQLGFQATDLKIVTALLVILALGAPSLRKFMIQDEFAEHLLERGSDNADNH